MRTPVIIIFLVQILYVSTGVTAEDSEVVISIYAHEMEEVLLHIQEDLWNQTVYAFWKKGNEHIATVFGNGSLHLSDDTYSDMLRSSPDGSLIIKAHSWQDDEEYSVDLMLMDNSHFLTSYKIHVNNKYIEHQNGPKTVSAMVGENVTLPLECEMVKSNEIEEIDWLTERWVYLAATKVDGNIRILESIYDGSLSCSPNGSLIFTRVTNKDQGMYRALLLLKKGIIMEYTFQVQIFDPALQSYADKVISSMAVHFTDIPIIIPIMTFMLILIVICLFIYLKKPSASRVLYKEEVETLSSQNKNNNP